MRLDKWLWFARFAKSRALAARLVEEGLVLLEGRTVKPHHVLRIGDRLALRRGRFDLRIEVRDLGLRRGPAAEARLLYAELAPATPVVQEEEWEPLIAE